MVDVKVTDDLGKTVPLDVVEDVELVVAPAPATEEDEGAPAPGTRTGTRP